MSARRELAAGTFHCIEVRFALAQTSLYDFASEHAMKAGNKASKRPSEQATAALATKVDPHDSARAAGLRYVSDTQPGIHRLKSGKSFRYRSADGKPLRDKEDLARIHALVIPPAWTDVWICANPLGHLQASGRDVRGRKQSRYHARWRQTRDATKYERMTAFAKVLPKLRRRIRHDLALPGLPKERILATLVRLMEVTLIRIGNEEYARTNHSYGLTTMRNRHVEVNGEKITFSFLGKSRVHHTIDLHDRRLAKIVKQCADIPGYELFQYLDHDGHHHSVDSSDVNAYLHEVTGQDFTAKDFRTWAGSVMASDLLREFGPFASEAEAKRNIVQAIAAVASKLGNTPSVCRKCYVHPAVLDAYLGSASVRSAQAKLDREIVTHAKLLHREEQALVALLEQQQLLAKAKRK
jgi:DNA topoisomerase-1